MGEDEHGSGKGVVDAARLLGLHPVADVGGPPADEHRAGGGRDLVELVRPDEVGELATSAPVHHMAGSGDEAVKRNTPVYDHLAVSGARIAHPVPHRDSLRGRTPQEAAGYRFLAQPGATALLLRLSKSSTLTRASSIFAATGSGATGCISIEPKGCGRQDCPSRRRTRPLPAQGVPDGCDQFSGAANRPPRGVRLTGVVSRDRLIRAIGGTMTADENAAIMRRAYE